MSMMMPGTSVRKAWRSADVSFGMMRSPLACRWQPGGPGSS
jgi:hypothetical protein